MKLEEKLDRVVARYEHLGHRLATGDTGESRDYAKLTREYAAMTPIVQSIEALPKLRRDRSGLEAMIEGPAPDGENREQTGGATWGARGGQYVGFPVVAV